MLLRRFIISLSILLTSLLGLEIIFLLKRDALSPFLRQEIALVFIICTAVAIILTGYFIFNIIKFKKQLKNAMKEFLEGNFDAGLGENGWDKFLGIKEDINKFMDRVRIYDKLRTDKVAYYNKIFKIIFRNINEGLMIIDEDKNQIKFNPACQKIFNISREEFEIETIINIPENKLFETTWKNVLASGISKTIKCRLYIPVAQSRPELYLHFVPFKDNQEKISLCLVKVQEKNQKIEDRE